MVWPTASDKKLDEYNAMDLPGQQLPAAQALTPLDHVLHLDIKAPPACQRLTGIIATMGKSTYDIEVMEKMIAAGMNIALLNLSFGTLEDHVETIKLLRQAAKNYSTRMGKNYPLAIAARLPGKKIRTGFISDSYGETVELVTGESLRLTTDETYKDRCSTYTVYVDYMHFAEQISKGDYILLDNETIVLKVEMISSTTLTCLIERGGHLGSFKDVFVPNVTLDMPNYTESDKIYIDMAVRNQLDILVASFVNSSNGITELRYLMGEKGKKIAIVANIQTIEGFRNFDDIMSVASGVMMTRQELGSDITPKKLVIAQKNMIARANKANIPICVSAHLLSSMRYNEVPLRSELLDIANCVLDGADALVLSAETAVGLYPVNTVQCMATVCKEAEACVWTKQLFSDLIDKTPLPCDQTTGTAIAAVMAAQRSLAAAIIAVTTSGKSAQVLSKYKPRCPIIAVTRFTWFLNFASCHYISRTVLPCDQTTGTAIAAVMAAQRSLAAAIVAVTTSGKSAQVLSKYKPRCPIIAVTRYAIIAKQLHLWRGVIPVIYECEPTMDWQTDVENRVNFCVFWAMEQGFVRIGDPLVVISGWRQGSGYTNTMRIIYAPADTAN